MFVSSDVVEWSGLKPCWVGDRGMKGLVKARTSLSAIFEGVQRRVMGLYEAGSVGFLLGLRMVIILPFFQIAGNLHWLYHKQQDQTTSPTCT